MRPMPRFWSAARKRSLILLPEGGRSAANAHMDAAGAPGCAPRAASGSRGGHTVAQGLARGLAGTIDQEIRGFNSSLYRKATSVEFAACPPRLQVHYIYAGAGGRGALIPHSDCHAAPCTHRGRRTAAHDGACRNCVLPPPLPSFVAAGAARAALKAGHGMGCRMLVASPPGCPSSSPPRRPARRPGRRACRLGAPCQATHTSALRLSAQCPASQEGPHQPPPRRRCRRAPAPLRPAHRAAGRTFWCAWWRGERRAATWARPP